ncbi:MAG: hypothetical protein EZS28_002765 [Streblomastix strix]|uniref:Uncharacterized protein n=1 Tax=Streblomastix strix TaxID=222440 RepID=A0A5J4X3B7_9EUKA|nr:MAG: hypothetical protein EZS28_002765 [Streblomastix strix]
MIIVGLLNRVKESLKKPLLPLALITSAFKPLGPRIMLFWAWENTLLAGQRKWLLFIITEALDLYDGINENGSNQISNLSSSIKQIDLETWFYKTKFPANRITMETVGGNRFNNVCFKQNLVDDPVLCTSAISCQILELTTAAGGGEINKFIDDVYEKQNHKAFKIAFDFGVIYEEKNSDKLGHLSVSYGNIRPNEAKTQKHTPKSIIKGQDIEEYKEYVKSEIIDMQNFNLDNTKQQKGIKEHSRELMAKEHMAKFYELPYETDDNEFQKWLNDFTGFDIETEIDEFVLREKINVNIYSYSVESQTYHQSKVYKHNEDVNEAADESNDETVNEPVVVPDFNVVIDETSPEKAIQRLNDQAATLTQAFYISNKETLTGLKFCPFCTQKASDPKDIHFVAQYEKHIKKCEINKVEKIINKDFGKSNKQISQLVPLSVASTIKNKQVHFISQLLEIQSRQLQIPGLNQKDRPNKQRTS